MRETIPDETLSELLAHSHGTLFRTRVEEAVAIYFRSAQYLASRSIADCVTLNLLLNDEITIHSADEIIRYMRRINRAFYTTVEAMYPPIEDKFMRLAKTAIDDFDKVLSMGLRKANLLVYVISKSIEKSGATDKYEIFKHAYTYKELIDIDLPHY